MTDSTIIFPAGLRMLDATGDPVESGSLEFFTAGTSYGTTRAVYSDTGLATALGVTVALDAGGYPITSGSARTLIYTGLTPYAVRCKDASGTVVWQHDNVSGALDTSVFLTDAFVSSRAVVAIAADRAISAADKGKLIDVNCTGATRTVTFPSALTLGDGFFVGLRMSGTANAVNVVGSLAQTFDVSGATQSAFALIAKGETVWITCDGAGFKVDGYVPPLVLGGTGLIQVADVLSAPPASPNPGAYYILGAAPSGAWSGYAQHDLVRADGQGTWQRQTLPADCGLRAFVQDEDRDYQMHGAAWVAVGAATQTEMEALAAGAGATPASMQWHPGVAKAWCKVTVSGGVATLNRSHGVASVTRNSNGVFTVDFTTPFSDTHYAGLVSFFGQQSSSSAGPAANVFSQAVGSCVIATLTATSSGNTTSIAGDFSFMAAFFGDQ